MDTYTTDAFGNSVASTGSATNPYQWNAGGKYYSDTESGLQKVGARYYEPATGRWITQDTELVTGGESDGQGVNRYVYCDANPVYGTDENGHGALAVVLGGLAVLGGAAGIYILVEAATGGHLIFEFGKAAHEADKKAQQGKHPTFGNMGQQANNPDNGPAYENPQPRQVTLPPGVGPLASGFNSK